MREDEGATVGTVGVRPEGEDEAARRARFAAAFARQAEAYLAELSRRGYTPASRKHARNTLAAFGRFLHGADPPLESLSQLAPRHFEAFRQRERTRPRRSGSGRLTPDTVAGTISAVRVFLTDLASRGVIGFVPPRGTPGGERAPALSGQMRADRDAVSERDGVDPFDDAAIRQTAFAAAFHACAERYLAELARRGYAKTTIHHSRVILSDLGVFLRMEAPRPLRTLYDITPDLVAAFRDYDLSRPKKTTGEGPRAATTLRRTVSVLRGFFAYLASQGLMLLDPARDMAYPRTPQHLPRAVPTVRQMRQLLASASSETALGLRDRSLVELLYSSGLRNAELCALRQGDIDLASRTVHVRCGKGGRERIVPMGRTAAEALERYLDEAWRSLRRKRAPEASCPQSGDPIFLTRVGTALSPYALRRLVRVHRRRGKVEVPVTPHALRHACATHLLKGGADIRQIQVLLGHASLKSTEIYTRVETSDLKRMLDRCHPRREPA